MISNQKKHQEKSKVSNKVQQPFSTPIDGMAGMLGMLSKMQKVKKKRK